MWDWHQSGVRVRRKGRCTSLCLAAFFLQVFCATRTLACFFYVAKQRGFVRAGVLPAFVCPYQESAAVPVTGTASRRRDVCSTAQMSSQVRLHREGCLESIGQAMVDETWAAMSQSERSLESYPLAGCSNHETEGGSPHTRQ